MAQGWPPPLTDINHKHIMSSLRRLAATGVCRKHPPQPPISFTMLQAQHDNLNMSNSFDAAVWATAACRFFGLMRMGKLTWHTRNSFDPNLHLTGRDTLFELDNNRIEYAKLTLTTARWPPPAKCKMSSSPIKAASLHWVCYAI